LAPTEHGAIGNKTPVSARTFAMDLEDEGWEGYGLVGNFVLRQESGLARGFRFFDVFAGRREQQIPKQALTVGGAAIDGHRRLFLWAHFMAPHQPYTPPPELAARYTEAVGPKASTAYLQQVHEHPEDFGTEEIERLRALYDAEVRHAGEMVQELLSSLDKRYRDAGRGGLLDTAVLLFVADHGEELADRYGYFNHAKSLYAGVTRVPPLVLGKGWEAGHREPAAIGLADVLSMVLDGKAPPEGYRISAWHRRFYAVRDARWTLVHNPADDRHGPNEPPQGADYPYPVVALYDRAADPLETIDVSASHPAVTRRMLDALSDWYGNLRLAAETGNDTLSDQDSAILEELGYASAPEQPAGGATAPWNGNRWSPDEK